MSRLHVLFETRPPHAHSNVQVFLSIAHYIDEAYGTANARHVQRLLTESGHPVVVAYIDHTDAQKEPALEFADAIRSVLATTKPSDALTFMWTGPCPISRAVAYSVFSIISERLGKRRDILLHI